jgi:hypothetical protein
LLLQTSEKKHYVLIHAYPSGAGFTWDILWGILLLMCMQDIKDIKVLMYCTPMGYDSFGLPAEQYDSNWTTSGRYDISKY